MNRVVTRLGAGALLAAVLCGCARPVRAPARTAALALAPAPAPAPAPLSPFDDTAVSFFVRGYGLVRGARVIVRVCVGADHAIVSADVVESSGDAHFDQLAVGWARQVRLRTSAAKGAPVASCGAVRVQMRRVPDTPLPGTRDNVLG